jgi:hypothetical protein
MPELSRQALNDYKKADKFSPSLWTPVETVENSRNACGKPMVARRNTTTTGRDNLWIGPEYFVVSVGLVLDKGFIRFDTSRVGRCGPLAQLDRAPGSDPDDARSSRARPTPIG